MKLIGYITAGMIEGNSEHNNMNSFTTSKEQADYWMKECGLWVKEVYINETPLNKEDSYQPSGQYTE